MIVTLGMRSIFPPSSCGWLWLMSERFTFWQSWGLEGPDHGAGKVFPLGLGPRRVFMCEQRKVGGELDFLVSLPL